MKSVDVDLGSTGRYGGSFTISDPSITVGTVTITQAADVFKNKGSLKDESEMDQVRVNGYVMNRGAIQAYWTCDQMVMGYFKFNYKVE